MTTWPLPLVGNTLFLDNSSQERIQTCSRSAGYYICHRRELTKERAALEFGRIMHKVLEARYRQAGPIVAATIATMMSEVTTGFTSWSVPEDEWRNYGVMVSAVQQYIAQYPLEDFDIVTLPDGTPFIEQKFALPIGEITVNADLLVREPDGTIHTRHVTTIVVVQKGKIDLAYRREGRLYGMDHKTTSVMGAQYFKEFELSSQIHCYSWALQKLLSEPVTGYAINGLGIRKPTKTGKALEYTRSIIPVFPSLVAEWVTDTLSLVSRFVDECRTNYLPKETKWCVGKYGLCEYKQVCGLSADDQRLMCLGSNEYRDVTFDPLTE